MGLTLIVKMDLDPSHLFVPFIVLINYFLHLSPMYEHLNPPITVSIYQITEINPSIYFESFRG